MADGLVVPGFEQGTVRRSAVRSASGPGYLVYVLAILLLFNTLAFADRAVFSVVAHPIKQELQLSDSQLGLLGGIAFVLVYTFFALPIARLAEHHNRINLISICLAVWSLATTGSGLAVTYWQMMASRVVLGAGEAGATPTAHSVIGDYFPPHRRGMAIAVFALGVPLGTLVGSLVGGYVSALASWRLAFLTVGVAGLVVALLIKLTVAEPARGGAEGHGKSADAPPLLATVRHLLGRPSFIHMATAFTLCALATGGIYVFLPTVMIRQFGLDVGTAGLIFGLLSGVGSSIGMLLGGYLTDRLSRRDRRWFAWFPGIVLAISPPMLVIGLAQPNWQAMIAWLIVPFILKLSYLPPALASFHNMTEPRMRATTISIVFIGSNVIGTGLGPLFAGMISDYFGGGGLPQLHAALCGPSNDALGMCVSLQAYGLNIGVALCCMIGWIAALFYFLAGRTIERDFVH